jgi:hypothetical protein
MLRIATKASTTTNTTTRRGMRAGAGQARGRRTVPNAFRLAAAGLVAAALVKELRTPAEERTWHGDLAGVVPYDFRPPTVERLRERVWAPDDPRVIMPRVFGVGWTLNVGRVVHLVRRRATSTPPA